VLLFHQFNWSLQLWLLYECPINIYIKVWSGASAPPDGDMILRDRAVFLHTHTRTQTHFTSTYKWSKCRGPLVQVKTTEYSKPKPPSYCFLVQGFMGKRRHLESKKRFSVLVQASTRKTSLERPASKWGRLQWQLLKWSANTHTIHWCSTWGLCIVKLLSWSNLSTFLLLAVSLVPHTVPTRRLHSAVIWM